ncbi:MAG: OmpA family protein [Elusimicrobiota bacterium]
MRWFFLLLLGAALSGCVSSQKYKLLSDAAEKSQYSLASAHQTIAVEKKRAEGLDATLARAKERITQLSAERERLHGVEENLSKALSAKSGELAQMNLKLQDETTKAKASLAQAQERIGKLERRVEELSLLQDQLSAKASQLDKERVQLRQSNEELTQSLKSGQDELSRTVSKLSAEKQELASRIGSLTKAQEELDAKKTRELEETKTTYEGLLGELKDEIEQGEVKITQYQNKLTVNVAEKIFFDSGRAAVKESGREVLLRVADVIRHLPDKQIRIEGHTDNVPLARFLREKYPTNWELSTARATNVARLLQEKAGLDPTLLSVAGYGEYRPIASNEAPEGRAQNRRIEIVLLDRDLGLPAGEAEAPPMPVEPLRDLEEKQP